MSGFSDEHCLRSFQVIVITTSRNKAIIQLHLIINDVQTNQESIILLICMNARSILWITSQDSDMNLPIVFFGTRNKNVGE